MNRAAINIPVQVFCECLSSLLLGKYLGVGLLGHVIILIFKGTDEPSNLF